jgi:hypothetical protein
MRKIYLLSGIMMLLLLVNCSVGVKKDLGTGLKVSNTDLTFNETALIIDSVKISTNEFPMNKDIFYEISGLKGFKEKNGKVYIGASITVLDDQNKSVLDYADLFSKYDEEGLDAINVGHVTLKLKTGPPLLTGKKYIWKTRVWDKNSKGEVKSEMEFTVK